MENKKLESLLKSNEFMQSIMKMETPEEVQKAFEEKGVNISKEEVLLIGSIVNETIKKGSVLSEPELAKIVGGNGKANDHGSNANDEDSKPHGFGESFVVGAMLPVGGFVKAPELKGKERLGAVMGNTISIGALLAAGGAIGIGLEHVTKKFVRWARKK